MCSDRLLASLAALLTLLLAGSTASAAPPSDVEVFNTVRTIQLRYAELEQQDFHGAKRRFRSMIRDVAAGLDLAALSPYQVSMIGPMLEDAQLADDARAAFVESLERAAGDEQHGASALVLLQQVRWDLPGDPYIVRFLSHPSMAETMNSWYGPMAMNSFSFEPALMAEHLERVERAILSIRPDSYTEAPSRAMVARLFDALDHPDVAARTSEARSRIHRHLLAIARSTLAKFAPTGGASHAPQKHQIDRAVDLVEYLEGPASRGQLAGQPAPALTFDWSRGPDAPFTSLADLRGKVIVLDFWATWCGPCVAGFPKLRELQAHYADEAVVIIGVTSIQGVHVPIGGAAVPLEGDPDNERTLMAELMRTNDVTWNIAYSTRSVIDPRYDVWGIPHLTIIDPAGVIRHNGANPGQLTLDELTALIDPLLAALRGGETGHDGVGERD